MIGISGLARAGKDTLARCFKKIIEREFDCEVEILHLADRLKSDLDKTIACNFNFEVFTEKDSEKELIRPILVAYGEAMKEKWGKKVWIEKLHEDLKKRKNGVTDLGMKKKFYIIADVRFDFEAEYIKENLNGFVVHIAKNGYEVPANEVEKKNDPLVKAVSDIQHVWPQYIPDNLDECNDHAEILWQMTPQEIKEKWQKTLI